LGLLKMIMFIKTRKLESEIHKTIHVLKGDL